MKKKNRPNDVISIPHRSYVSLNGVLVCMKTLDRVLLCLFARYLMFFIIDNQLGILSYQIRQLPCHARGARAHNLFSLLPFRMNNFVDVNGISFRYSIDWWLVCTIQNNHNLDALIHGTATDLRLTVRCIALTGLQI